MSIRFLRVSLIFYYFMALASGFKVTLTEFDDDWMCSSLCNAADIMQHRACDHFDVIYKSRGCETMEVHLVADQKDKVGTIENRNILQCVLRDDTIIYLTKGNGRYPLLQWYNLAGWLYPNEFIDLSPSCWENCQLLQANYPIWGGICSEQGICFPGCQEACKFHREMSPVQQSVPVIQTRGEEVIFVKNQTAYWPKPSRIRHGSGDPLVYVVMRRLPGKMWRQITQTLDTSSRVSEDLSSGAMLRVLVVDRDGLLTIYSPVASESSLRSANDIARSSGQNSLNNLFASGNSTGEKSSETGSGKGRRINTEIVKNTSQQDSNRTSEIVAAEYTAWNLREISLIHQKVLVIAEIAWDAVPTYVVQRPVYFVTWEVDGGGLKGNLFTDSTCVTLSLWPDTVYHIQVELVSQDTATGRPQQSEDFLLDTHRAVAVELETSPPDLSVLTAAPDTPKSQEIDSNDIFIRHAVQSAQSHVDARGTPHKIDMLVEKQQIEIYFAVGAAFAVFILVLVVLVYASCRHSDVISYPRPNSDIFSIKPGKKVDSHFPKEFVPILTLVTENISKRTLNSHHSESSDKPSYSKTDPNHIRNDPQSSTNLKHYVDEIQPPPRDTNNVCANTSQRSYCDRNIKNDYVNRSNIS